MMDNPDSSAAGPGSGPTGSHSGSDTKAVPKSQPQTISVPVPVTLAATIIIIAGLYVARDVLIPIALAVLLSFLLTPLVRLLHRWHLPRIPAVLVAVGFGSACIAALLVLVTMQAVNLAGSLPEYQGNIEDKVQSLRSSSDGAMGRLLRMFSSLDHQTDPLPPPTPDAPSAPSNEGASPGDPSSAAPPPVPVFVEIVTRSLTPLDILGKVLGTTLGPLSTAGIVFVFVVFFLLAREDIRYRLVGALGQRPGQLYVTTKALDDVNTRISRYLLMQLIVNVTYGIPIGVGLFFIGVPNPILWALLTVVLRFVPFVGPLIAAAFPIALAFAVDPGWGMVIWTVLLFAVIEIASNNVVEPWLYGSSTGISPVGILLSALFWAVLWGPIGLLMSTPLTICFVVLGRHVPALYSFTLLLGDKSVFSLHAKIYQRFLARDPDEPDELARAYLADHTVEDFYGQVLVPVLGLLEADRHYHNLDQESHAFILESTRALIEDLAEHPDPESELQDRPALPTPGSGTHTMASEPDPSAQSQHTLKDGPLSPDPPPISPRPRGEMAQQPPPLVVCVPAHDESDELVGLMLSNLLRRRAIRSSTISARLLNFERLEKLADLCPPTVCISIMPPFATVHARHIVQRIRARMPTSKIIVGFWDTDEDPSTLLQRLAPATPVTIVTSLKQATLNLASL